MRRATIDTSEATAFEAIEPGPYTAVVDRIEDPAPSQAKGTMGTWVYFQLTDPTVAKKAGNLRRFYPLGGKGAGLFREFWKAITGEDIPLNAQIDVDLDAGIGRPCVVVVTNREYEGKVQNEVSQVVASA